MKKTILDKVKIIYRILGSFIFVDLLLLTDTIYDTILLVLHDMPIMRSLNTVNHIVCIFWIICCIWKWDGKVYKFLGNDNHLYWNISKNSLVTCWVLNILFAFNPVTFKIFQILSILAAYIFFVVQLWCIKTSRVPNNDRT